MRIELTISQLPYAAGCKKRWGRKGCEIFTPLKKYSTLPNLTHFDGFALYN